MIDWPAVLIASIICVAGFLLYQYFDNWGFAAGAAILAILVAFTMGTSK